LEAQGEGMSEFDKGVKYGIIKDNSRRNLFFGYGSLIFSIVFLILIYIRGYSDNNLWTSIILFFIGAIFLWKGYSEKKEAQLIIEVKE
jgi:predicted membrane protein